MKFFHLSDLHLGKRVNGFSMIEDQKFILNQILTAVREYNPEGILIAGDIYDKPVPSTEAVQLLDCFLKQLADFGTEVFLISGNHDSAERIAFGAALMEKSGIYVSPVYYGNILSIQKKDEYGEVNVYLFPFIKPAHVRKRAVGLEINSYEEAFRFVLQSLSIDSSKRNIALVHQFITGANQSDSEESFLGGLEQIQAELFQDFDYVALGHIHRSQNMGKNIRYCGSPLKYSFSEANDEKSITLLTLTEKGNVHIEQIPLHPRCDMREIRGAYKKLTTREAYEGTEVSDYLHVTLTDEEDIPDALGKLRTIYPNIMKLDYDNRRTKEYAGEEKTVDLSKSPKAYVEELYEIQNNQKLNEIQCAYINQLIQDIWDNAEGEQME